MKNASPAPLHERLSFIAGVLEREKMPSAAEDVREAAAQIEGHNEAFTVVVDQKRELGAELKQLRRNHEHTLDFIARWRELLVALRAERPDDIRIKRALAGEHPMRPAPWEQA